MSNPKNNRGLFAIGTVISLVAMKLDVLMVAHVNK